jgi:DNA invertase Pin-like site-specific DNA recombinase
MRLVIYARVSTKDQNCDLQLRDFRAYRTARGIAALREYVDIGESGAKDSAAPPKRLMAAWPKRQFRWSWYGALSMAL